MDEGGVCAGGWLESGVVGRVASKSRVPSLPLFPASRSAPPPLFFSGSVNGNLFCVWMDTPTTDSLSSSYHLYVRVCGAGAHLKDERARRIEGMDGWNERERGRHPPRRRPENTQSERWAHKPLSL